MKIGFLDKLCSTILIYQQTPEDQRHCGGLGGIVDLALMLHGVLIHPTNDEPANSIATVPNSCSASVIDEPVTPVGTSTAVFDPNASESSEQSSHESQESSESSDSEKSEDEDDKKINLKKKMIRNLESEFDQAEDSSEGSSDRSESAERDSADSEAKDDALASGLDGFADLECGGGQSAAEAADVDGETQQEEDDAKDSQGDEIKQGEVTIESPSTDDDQEMSQLKKNLANKIFGYLARCDFWAKLGW